MCIVVYYLYICMGVKLPVKFLQSHMGVMKICLTFLAYTYRKDTVQFETYHPARLVTDACARFLISWDRGKLYNCLLGKRSSPFMDSTPSHVADMAIIPARLEFSPVSAKYLVNSTLQNHTSTMIHNYACKSVYTSC